MSVNVLAMMLNKCVSIVRSLQINSRDISNGHSVYQAVISYGRTNINPFFLTIKEINTVTGLMGAQVT